jgi:4-coumarate--CoA ligase
VYLMRRYQPESFVAYLHQYQITEVALVNPIVMNLLRLPAFKRELLLSLRFAWVAGAPLDASTQNQLSSILHEDAIVCQVWGMTEIGWITTLRYPERDRTGSVGRLLPNVEARYVMKYHLPYDGEINGIHRLVDKSLNEINGNGTWGEILIKSPSMMTSYLKNLDATDSTILGGWLRTGDIGYQNGGKWYIIDRAKVFPSCY